MGRGWPGGPSQGGPVRLGVRMLLECDVASVGWLDICGCRVWIDAVGGRPQLLGFQAGFGCEEGDGEVRLVWGRYVEGLYG